MPHRIRLSILFSAFLVLTFFAPSLRAAVVLDRTSAVNAVVSELVLTPDTWVWCPHVDYGVGHVGLLPTGTKIRPEFPGTAPNSGSTVTLTNPMYVFLVDDLPWTGFGHTVSFVYVDATVSTPSLVDGTIRVETQGWWPVIQRPSLPEESFFGPNGNLSSQPPGPANPDGLVFGLSFFLSTEPPSQEIPDEFLVPLDIADNTNTCVLMVTGVDSTNDAYGKAVGRSLKRLKQEFLDRGVPPGRILSRINATKAELRQRITALCAFNPPCEKIYVYLGTHGKPDTLQFKGGPVPADTLCSILKPLGAKTVGGKSVPVCTMIEACYSGSLVPELRPKFPSGVMLTAADSLRFCYGDPIDGVGPMGNFSYLLMQCWDAPGADSLGDNNGIVDWTEAMKWVCTAGRDSIHRGGGGWSMKAFQHPTLTGLPAKINFGNVPGVGWTSEVKYDSDQNGSYENCTWRLDTDCDGHAEHVNSDYSSGGGEIRYSVYYEDEDDDGLPETRYEMVDSNDDGHPDQLSCWDWTGFDWFLTVSMGRRTSDSFQISPASGPKTGGQAFSITGTSTSWFNPNLTVFIGSQASAVVWNSPTQISGVTRGYFAGSRDVIVADFDPFSPSFGYDILIDGYDYTSSFSFAATEPNRVHCEGSGFNITLRGDGFVPGAQATFAGLGVPTTWVDGQTLTAMISSCAGFPLGPVAVRVQNPDLTSATLDSALTFLPARDVTPPVISCPPNLVLEPGPDLLARTPPGWTAGATDDGGVAVVRNQQGALPVGVHSIVFDAIDAAGNRSSCSATVQVGMAGGSPADPGMVLATPHPNPFADRVMLRVTLRAHALVKLQVFTPAGQLVATLVDGRMEAGEHEILWQGRRSTGELAANGVYFVRGLAGDVRVSEQVVLRR